ncbi:16S rRNA (cytosine(1402)-N(4))-methyltransferase RsmH [Desulfopila sp. IMCC35008]|uniref:16S rRNA (cytosine(1402)-N(4))-methyltransferase RsmH n=1 Tax=Desulfopila sp. IMCC35008 TaxID=2653858 RepID=UPI0013D48FF6|nr:16S rRNA (cytosine(1402)-N(4))-methyltransferase RsmH [Desulfopila sp. IMCC35008]
MALERDIERIHISVLADEVLQYLKPVSGGIYMDGTLGLGGHSLLILEASSPEGRVIGFEWDENAIARSRTRLKDFGERLTIVRRNFAEIALGLQEAGVEKLDGLLIDIGLSSLQLDMGDRGFSFQRDEPLDMRMDSRREITAAKIIKQSTEEQLADIFYYYGEERQARRIASFIAESRKQEEIKSSGRLAELVSRAVPRRYHPKKIHVATKVFQALRIAVNTELENLSRIIDEAPALLKPGARFCVISFHSLEDRIVKRKFREHSDLNVLTPRPVTAGAGEVSENPRSRSAKLRVAERI